MTERLARLIALAGLALVALVFAGVHRAVAQGTQADCLPVERLAVALAGLPGVREELDEGRRVEFLAGFDAIPPLSTTRGVARVVLVRHEDWRGAVFVFDDRACLMIAPLAHPLGALVERLFSKGV